MSPGDAQRLSRLRRMKTVALSLLGLAAVVYLLTLRLDHTGVWGYVNTAAEAAMVGAMADWFAVTALFRHPLGVPIPHTAIIPRKKDELAGSLQSFFADNFLTEKVVRERLASAHLARRLGVWLQDEAHARRLVVEAVRLLKTALNKVDDEDVLAVATDVLLPRLAQERAAPMTGALLEAIVEDHAHTGLVDLIMRELHAWLGKNPTYFTAVLHDRAPRWSPHFVNQRVVSALYWQALDWVAAVRDDPDHPTRQALDALLLRIATDLTTDEAVQARAEGLKVKLLPHPQAGETVLSLWRNLRVSLSDSLDDPDSTLRLRVVSAVESLGASLTEDQAQQARVDALAADAAGYLVATYGRELSSVISHTIRQWDGRDAANRIELYVGRDLQFIRINGTVVGALVGLVIHALTQLLQ